MIKLPVAITSLERTPVSPRTRLPTRHWPLPHRCRPAFSPFRNLPLESIRVLTRDGAKGICSSLVSLSRPRHTSPASDLFRRERTSLPPPLLSFPFPTGSTSLLYCTVNPVPLSSTTQHNTSHTNNTPTHRTAPHRLLVLLLLFHLHKE